MVLSLYTSMVVFLLLYILMFIFYVFQFASQGNENFKHKKYQEAIDGYSRSISFLSTAVVYENRAMAFKAQEARSLIFCLSLYAVFVCCLLFMCF